MAVSTASQVSKAYDHPAYTVPVMVAAGINAAGASALTSKFAAYTAMKLKAVTFAPVIATTAAGSTPLIYTKSGTATATATLAALTSASNASATYALATSIALAQGDQFWATHGTDATAVISTTFELQVTPTSNISSQAT